MMKLCCCVRPWLSLCSKRCRHPVCIQFHGHNYHHIRLPKYRVVDGNVKIRHLCNEVPAGQFCGRTVTELNPGTSSFYISCYYFEVGAKINEKNRELFEGCCWIWTRLTSCYVYHCLFFTCYSFQSLQIFLCDSASIQLNQCNTLFYVTTT